MSKYRYLIMGEGFSALNELFENINCNWYFHYHFIKVEWKGGLGYATALSKDIKILVFDLEQKKGQLDQIAYCLGLDVWCLSC